MRHPLRFLLLSALLFVLVVPVSAYVAHAQEFSTRPELEELFSAKGVSGTLVVSEVGRDSVTVVNAERARTRFIPASTFKIANSLIALETGTVSSIDEVIPYGGKPQPFKRWEKDMSMRDAIAISNVPVYQELARRIGLANYKAWLGHFEYGNGDTGLRVDRFWLDGPLEISALEQVAFLKQLISAKLPVAAETVSNVSQIMELERNEHFALYAKTGWASVPYPDIGWFVGWVEAKERVHVFAMNMDMKRRSDANLRIPLTKELLLELGVF